MIAAWLDGPRVLKGLYFPNPSALRLNGWRLLGWRARLLRYVVCLGHWPARLSEGYTALISKEGPPRSLNTRLFRGLSMVYRLWAGVRLVDAIAWQDFWAHPAAFGFRPTRCPLVEAAVTQILLELCHLRAWTVAGISIDYVN